MEEFLLTAARTVVKAPTALYLLNPHVQRPQLDVQTEEYHLIAAQTEVKALTASFRRNLLDQRLQPVRTEVFHLTAVQTEEQDPTA